MLNHDDGVGAVRNACAGHNLDGFAGLDATIKPLARAHFADHTHTAGHVRATDREPVARSTVERRVIAIGMNISGEHASVRRIERYGFNGP